MTIDSSPSEWLYGRRTVAEHLAVCPETARRLRVARGAKVDAGILARTGALGLPVETVPRVELDRQFRRANHQGVALEVGGWAYTDIDAVVRRARGPGRLPLIIALDGVEDPRNLGAVLRVADGVGAAGVVIPKDRAAGLSAAVARTASGAAAAVPVARVTNLARTLDGLKKDGFWVVGTAGEGAEDLYAAALSGPAVLVLGAEHRGLRPNVRKRCDRLVSIPLEGAVSSLNVAVACGVVAYELRRRQTLQGPGEDAFRMGRKA